MIAIFIKHSHIKKVSDNESKYIRQKYGTIKNKEKKKRQQVLKKLTDYSTSFLPNFIIGKLESWLE